MKVERGKAAGEVHLEVPRDGRCEPASRHFELAGADEQTMAEFDIDSARRASRRARCARSATVGDPRSIASGRAVIDYPHIPGADAVPARRGAAGARAISRSWRRTSATSSARAMKCPEALRQMGCEVTLLSPEDLARGDLEQVRRDRHRRPRLEHPGRSARQLSAAVQVRGGRRDADRAVQRRRKAGSGPAATADTPARAHIGPYPIKTAATA